MKKIRINIELDPNPNPRSNEKLIEGKPVFESFLEVSGIDVETHRKICPETFTPFMLGVIVDEEKFSKYIAENKLNYQILND